MTSESFFVVRGVRVGIVVFWPERTGIMILWPEDKNCGFVA